MKRESKSRSARTAAVIRRPLLHFVLLGLALYVAQAAWWQGDAGAPEPVIVDTAAVGALTRDWTRTTGRAPTDTEIDRLVQDHVDQELLLRAALARGLQHTDALVTRRLIQNQRFIEVSEGEPGTTDAELLERAYALGLERTDLVVRRRLIERMLQIIWAAAPQPTEPTPSTDEPLLRVSHVFVSRDRHGTELNEAAQRVRAELTRKQLEPDDPEVASLGDPLLLPRDLPPSTPGRLATRLGASFAKAVSVLATGVWSQPLPSSYGLHLVWVHERLPAANNAGEAGRRAEPAATPRRAILEAALQHLRRDVAVIRSDRATSASDRPETGRSLGAGR